ncbi:conserved hypothetical protein [Leishmania major strain Friedlin]|uniref:Uncharacterized protein n=1 Tax=Leishmania major TaxID=5664 RepID=E9ADI1_LEIMA|nr:conserved hypothetical protein [Leishmania major strain Friedlin]CAG9576811.1 hypothetical_protein_-_conserved [Leishmania major strain Friedlin]CBZ12271.1 conserved hypothetical protein [Leishmania major strain Friedlin]|eukprot:XP_003722010.1 conserved hypothetical protein [Leishmania major strain Friedlin]
MPQRSHVPLASPSPLNAPPPLTSRPGPVNYCGAHAEPAAGLNYTHHDDHRSVFRDQASCDPSPSQRALHQQQVHRPRAVSPGPHDGSAPHVSALVARGAVIRADELETILDEQNYIWQMEEYRFRTERQKRLTALQHRQHELMLESARYDQAVAEVERQLARERQRLEELRQMMARNATTSCSPIDREHGLQDPPTAMSDAPHVIARNSSAMHHGQARDHAYSAPHDAPYFPTGASDGLSAMNEEEVIAEV